VLRRFDQQNLELGIDFFFSVCIMDSTPFFALWMENVTFYANKQIAIDKLL